MVTGFIDDAGHPKVELTVIGKRGEITLTPTIDTGFDGQLCLPTEVAIQLGLELIGRLFIELADGTRQRSLVFSGLVKIGATEEEVDIILTEADDSLVGTGLLQGRVVTLDFQRKRVEISEKG
jgi:clan AA aspartic protease